MKAYHNTAVLKFDDDTTGNAASGVPVTVRINSTQLNASIFDVDGVAIGNPLTTDSNGNYSFKSADNIYDIIVSEGTANEVKLVKVEIFDIPASLDLINDLSQAYEFATVAAMTASSVVFPDDKPLSTVRNKAGQEGGGANYIKTTGSSPDTFSPDLTGGGYAEFIESKTITDAKQIGIFSDRTATTAEFTEAEKLDLISISKGIYRAGNQEIDLDLIVSPLSQFTDADTGDEFRKENDQTYKFNITNAYSGTIKRTTGKTRPLCVAYGDSNTKYFQGDTTTAGPEGYAYGSMLKVESAEYPEWFGLEVEINGNPGDDSAFGIANITDVTSLNPDFVVLGWGTNNIKLSNPSYEDYEADMIAMIDILLLQNATPIILGIPSFWSGYGANGVTSQQRLKVWNASLENLCNRYGIAFIDTYNAFKDETNSYFNESTEFRHYSRQATRIIGKMILGAMNDQWFRGIKAEKAIINRRHLQADSIPEVFEMYPNEFASFGLESQFNTIRIISGNSIKIKGAGRLSLGFYPRAAATAQLTATGGYSVSFGVVITADTDAGLFYPITKWTSGPGAEGQQYDMEIAAVGGDVYLRIYAMTEIPDFGTGSGAFLESSGANLPTNPVENRAYIVTDLQKTARFIAGIWLDDSGYRCVGTTTQRDATSSSGFINPGFKFYNTTTVDGERWNGTTWVAI